MIDELLIGLMSLAGRIRTNAAVNVNSRAVKDLAVQVGTSYFEKYRPLVVGVLRESDELRSFDADWQQLIRLAQNNSPKGSYQKLIKRLVATAKEINVAIRSTVHLPEAVVESAANYTEAETTLVATLNQMVPTAGASYQQGMADLRSPSDRLSYRGTASEFRETLRETLDHLAPDKDVIAETWFKPEGDRKLPTMKQKVRFILASRGKNKTQKEAAEKTVSLIEELSGDIARAVYNRASLSTHVETTKQEVQQMKRYLDAVLFDLLEIS